ncbi:MAG: thioredoxin family protein [Candidatus Altiarchaeota archaeon]|nr:thioredoxin family protein [Candidatus Altiarchaeota archaeon]
MKIEILGMGCPKCLKLEENARKAVEESGIKAEIVKVKDVDKIVSYGVMMTPALVLDGKVKCCGKIATVDEIKGWIC